MTNEFEKWYSDNLIWMPDDSSMMFDVWESILQFTSNNRSCESCKYYQYCSIENGWTKSALPYYVCSNEHLDADGSWFRPYSKDFSCNKWEPKDKE